MPNCLTFKKSNCKNCYKCIRHCPVKAIRFSGNQAHIIGNECILCGQCFVVCPQNAKEIASELEKTKVIVDNYASLLKSGEVLPKDKLLYVQQLAVQYKKQKDEMEPLKEELRLIHGEMMQSNRYFVTVSRTVYPGVSITISDVGYNVKKNMNYL